MRTLPHPTVAATGRTERAGRHAYDDLEPDLRRLAAMDPADPERGPLRDRLICAFLPLVRNLSGRFRSGGHSIEDVEQAGTLGLIKAIDRYDPDVATGGALGYLVPSVRGEVLRHLRDHSWALRVPRDLKDRSVGVNRATATLTQRLGRAPRPTEIAEELDTTTGEVLDTLQALDSYRPASLDTPATEDGAPLSDRIGGDDSALETATLRGELRAELDELPERERRILLLRFYGNRTQSEIAAEVGLSQMHVSRLLSRTVARLRQALDG